MSVEGMEQSGSPYARDVRTLEQMRGKEFESGQQPADPELVLRIARLIEAKGGADTLAEQGFQDIADEMNEYYKLAGKTSYQPSTAEEVRKTYESFIKPVA